MEQERQKKAINAYVRFLEKKEVDKQAIDIRTKFVEKLAVLLDNQFDRHGYSQALQATTASNS